jgi:high-affinity nickel-transport protein
MRVFRDAQGGTTRRLDEHLNKRGFMNRFLGGLTKSVGKPWHIYPIGVLFGLGFDTATEVGLLVLAGGAAAFSLPFYTILVLPILFAAGMCLMDTADGLSMNAAYGWAFAKPVRKVFYNITITSISVAVALIIGTIELVGAGGPGEHHQRPTRLDRQHQPRLRRVRHRRLFFPRLIALAVWRFGQSESRYPPTSRGDLTRAAGDPQRLRHDRTGGHTGVERYRRSGCAVAALWVAFRPLFAGSAFCAWRDRSRLPCWCG